MKPTTNHPQGRVRAGFLAAGLLAVVAALAACGGTSGSSSTPTAAVTAAPGAGPVLPVKDNPISNTSTAQVLTIDSVLVENNVDTAGAAVTDHLEISLTNTGTMDLTGLEIFYTFDDRTTGLTESYYAKLPDTFTIAAGSTRIAHFDNTGAADHFPVSDFSLYSTDTNALDVTVTVSATDAAIQIATVTKDAGGPETAD